MQQYMIGAIGPIVRFILPAVDLVFGLSVAPGKLDGVANDVDVSAQDAGEAPPSLTADEPL